MDAENENTCYVERSAVRSLIIEASSVNNDVATELLADVDALPIFVAADLAKPAGEVERLREALAAASSWIERWTKHIGNCAGGVHCTCGRTAILFDATAALTDHEQ